MGYLTAADFQGQIETCINHDRLNIIEKSSFEFTITTAPYLYRPVAVSECYWLGSCSFGIYSHTRI